MGASLEDANEFLKAVYSDSIHTHLMREVTGSAIYKNMQVWARKSHVESEPLDPEYLAERTAWQERWKAVYEEGIEKGWLYHDSYEGIERTAEGDSQAEVEQVTVYDETVEEWRARQREMNGGKDTVTFPVVKRDES